MSEQLNRGKTYNCYFLPFLIREKEDSKNDLLSSDAYWFSEEDDPIVNSISKENSWDLVERKFAYKETRRKKRENVKEDVQKQEDIEVGKGSENLNEQTVTPDSLINSTDLPLNESKYVFFYFECSTEKKTER